MTQDNHLGNTRGVTTARTGGGSNVLSIIAFVLSGIAVFFIPILFGAAAVIVAVVALVRKERLAKVALVVAILATILGMVLGAIAFNAMT